MALISNPLKWCEDEPEAARGETADQRRPGSALGSEEHTFTGVVAGTFRRAPLAAKLYFIGFTLYMVGLTVWGVAGRRNGTSSAVPYVAVLGGGAGVLLGFSVALFRVAQGERWRQRYKWRLYPKRLNEMLLALPVLTFAAGAMAAAATAIIIPFARKDGWFIALAALTVYVTLASGRILMDATRYLYFHAREQAAAAERARAEATGAQLAALQAQVNPHFLFNALNTIAALVRMDPRAAEATTENLAHVLRRTLDRTRRTECTVEDEIDFIRAWLAVERERFGDRLRVDFSVDPGTETLRIPTMTLQPLVENSLKHGIAGKLEGGRVAVSVSRFGPRLMLEVRDDGAGFPREPREGTGLGNLRRRLETIYGADAELRVERPGSGARVVVEVPVGGGGNGVGAIGADGTSAPAGIGEAGDSGGMRE